MALLKTITSATDVTDGFTPGGDFAVQIETIMPAADLPDLVIDVEAAVDADAGWSPLHSWRLTEGAIKRFADLPRVRVRVRGNRVGNPVSVRYSS